MNKNTNTVSFEWEAVGKMLCMEHQKRLYGHMSWSCSPQAAVSAAGVDVCGCGAVSVWGDGGGCVGVWVCACVCGLCVCVGMWVWVCGL